MGENIDNTGSVRTFIGLRNYYDLLFNDTWSWHFWNALKNNTYFFLLHVSVQTPVGLLIAAFLSSRELKFKNTYRTLIFLPAMMSIVIVGYLFNLILSPLWGIPQTILGTVGLGDLVQPWLGLKGPALITISLISIWQFVGIPMMLFYAALLNIPDEILDAAKIDGSSPISTFWRIKFPLILPTVGLMCILTYVGNYNAFDLIFAMKSLYAGPEYSTDLMGTFFYRTFFGFQMQLGNPTMGATVASTTFGIILVGVLIYLFAFQRRITRYQY
jgi:raffinose/stachyose/melibiose transport system permease protein|tara:strand:- start:3484 stop:4299 length:816 start_codon:yes stop_codon:yes gene_type:complete